MLRQLGLWLWLLSLALTGTLAGQVRPLAGAVVDETPIPGESIPEGARRVKTEIILVDGYGVKLRKDTWVVDNEAPSPKTQEVPTLDVKNLYGAVRVEVRAVHEPILQARVHGRPLLSNDFMLMRDGGTFSIVATPPDGARVDLELTVPYGHLVRMETTDGDLSYDGLGKAELQTDKGEVFLRFPEELTSFELWADRDPEEFEGDAELLRSGEGWAAHDRLPEWRDGYGRVSMLPYGRVTLRANQPRAIKLELTESLPEDSPIQPHWRAKELLPNLFRFARKGLHRRDAPSEPEEATSEATFSADARLVQLEATATDRYGRPAADLTRRGLRGHREREGAAARRRHLECGGALQPGSAARLQLVH